MRYKCRRRQKPKNNLKDKTFSLLPHILIPYLSLTIDSLMLVVTNSFIKNTSPDEIRKSLDEFLIDEDRIYNMDSRHFTNYFILFKETLFKLNHFIDKQKIRAGPFAGSANMNAAVVFLKQYQNGYPEFSVYYYDNEGTYIKKCTVFIWESVSVILILVQYLYMFGQ